MSETQQPPIEPALLKPKDAARFLAISPRKLWSMTAARLLQDGYRGAVWARRWPKPSERIHDLQGLGCELHWRDYNAPSLMRRVLRRLHILPLPQEQGFRWFNSFQPDLIVVSLGFQGDVRSCHFPGRFHNPMGRGR